MTKNYLLDTNILLQNSENLLASMIIIFTSVKQH